MMALVLLGYHIFTQRCGFNPEKSRGLQQPLNLRWKTRVQRSHILCSQQGNYFVLAKQKLPHPRQVISNYKASTALRNTDSALDAPRLDDFRVACGHSDCARRALPYAAQAKLTLLFSALE